MVCLTKRPDRFSTATVDGDVVLIDLESGKFFAMRDTALEVWHALDRTDDLEAICADLDQRFDTDHDQCRRDVEAFARQLVDAGFATFT